MRLFRLGAAAFAPLAARGAAAATTFALTDASYRQSTTAAAPTTGRPVAIITGGSRGVGAATAQLLSEKGYDVVINFSTSSADAATVADSCRAAGARALLAQGNVGNDEDCRRIVADTISTFGRVDALVNNAGTTTFVQHTDMDALDADTFGEIQRVNTVGAFQMIRACRPHLRESAASCGRGSVVNVSSVAATHGFGSSLAYIASKGGLNSMSIALARALGPEGIRVNVVCPGFIEGDWLRKGLGGERYDMIKAHLEKSTPLRAVQSPMDVAFSIVFLLEAPKLTGDVVILDAGMRLTAA